MQKQTLNEIIQEKNEDRQREYKKSAHEIVSSIVTNQEKIVRAQRHIIDLKKQLNELQEPEEIKVEL